MNSLYVFGDELDVDCSVGNWTKIGKTIQELKEGKRKAPHKGGIPAFRYQIAPQQSVDRFVKEMEKKH